MTRDGLVAAIEATFTAPYPGDRWLQGSFEGCEPFDEVGAFVGITDWRTLEPAFLDAHYTALSFFSEAGLRFFLPAYLVADLHDALATADPLFGLIHGFSEFAYDALDADVSHRSGGPVLLGPMRYGAIVWEDAARHRLSVFCREEAAVIADYLRYRRDHDAIGTETHSIDAALDRFWVARSTSAPARAELDAFAH
jgi:hypothetical protein